MQRKDDGDFYKLAAAMDPTDNVSKHVPDGPEKPGALTLFVPKAEKAAAGQTAKAAPDAAARRVKMPERLPIYAAAVCFAVGAGGVLGSQYMQAHDTAVADAETAKIERALPWKRDVAEGAARDSGKLRDDLRALRGELAALRANNEQLRQGESQRQATELRAMRTTLEGQKSETASLKADMAARFDRADRDAAQRTDKTVERVDRLEKRLADPTPTATIAKAPEPPKPVVEAPKAEKPPVRGIVLRDAARGVALIETRRGLLEVMAGDVIPGAGRVETIEKRAGKWRVVTTTNIIDDQLN